MLLAELGNGALGSNNNNKGNEMDRGEGWAATRKPNNPHKRCPQPLPSAQMPP